MKATIGYPPLESDRGIPLLGQNRQFQWFSEPTYIYPIVPAQAATLLDREGHDVYWEDGIAQEDSYDEWVSRVEDIDPDLIAIETKTPVVKRHWEIIDELKERLPDTEVVLYGDHVTALPRESFHESNVDYVLSGGNYDFLLRNLTNHLDREEELRGGIYYRENRGIECSGDGKPVEDLDSLPHIDRELTKWWLYAEKNGNFKKTPGTYTMAGRDCWHHECTFCSWTTTYPEYYTRSPENVLDEIGHLIEECSVKEIFDDTGTFPIGDWLHRFCNGLIERGYSEEVRIGCNMRFGALNQEDYNLMQEAGFRMLLFGLESANQETLDRLKKGIQVRDIRDGCRMAKKAGLQPHVTAMVGYPWETKKEAQRTIDLAKELFRKGWVDTLQATITMPYPGTLLYEECKENDWLLTQDWNDYDMKQPVMKTPMEPEEVKKLTQDAYKVFFTPRYIARRLVTVNSLDDILFIKKGMGKLLGHLKDFR